ncbi:hypothetical protein MMB68_23645 [Priestia sp. Y58]|uniref:N-acyl amino acid synthase FeeM domain-containing protein n=1 Tax=Priestia TaxID=2800373 RepID=UPI00221ECEBA|nr:MULTISPECIES: hypothetical protein [Priestia]MDG0032549.1 hypothetical protein [Priestia sp. Y58]UYV51505.1 hypothetical protein OHU65_18180 [Priestia megaterium]
MYRKVTTDKENELYLEVFDNVWKFADSDYKQNTIYRYIMFTENGEVFGSFALSLYNPAVGSIEKVYSFRENVEKINNIGKVTIEIVAFALKEAYQGTKYFMQSVFCLMTELMRTGCDYAIAVTEPKLSKIIRKACRENLVVLQEGIIAKDDNTEWVAMVADLKPVFNNIDEYPLLKYGTYQLV